MKRRDFLKAAAAWAAMGVGVLAVPGRLDGPKARTYSLAEVLLTIGGFDVAGFDDDGGISYSPQYDQPPIETDWYTVEERPCTQ